MSISWLARYREQKKAAWMRNQVLQSALEVGLRSVHWMSKNEHILVDNRAMGKKMLVQIGTVELLVSHDIHEVTHCEISTKQEDTPCDPWWAAAREGQKIRPHADIHELTAKHIWPPVGKSLDNPIEWLKTPPLRENPEFEHSKAGHRGRRPTKSTILLYERWCQCLPIIVLHRHDSRLLESADFAIGFEAQGLRFRTGGWRETKFQRKGLKSKSWRVWRNDSLYIALRFKSVRTFVTVDQSDEELRNVRVNWYWCKTQWVWRPVVSLKKPLKNRYVTGTGTYLCHAKELPKIVGSCQWGRWSAPPRLSFR